MMKVFAAPAFSNEKVNPYNALLYRELQQLKVSVEEYRHSAALKNHSDIAHFHWPDGDINRPSLGKSLQRMLLLFIMVYALKSRGTKIVWTVHNTAPHDARRPLLSKTFMRWFARRCDGFIFMSEANRDNFFQKYETSPTSQHTIIPHGHYRSCYAPAIDQHTAKQQLELDPDKKVLLFIGMIKPYKNIDGLMKAFNQAAITDYQLVIAGTIDTAPPELRTALEKLKNNNTHLFLHFIPDSELNVFMSAADAVILPYKAILNSGALLLALSYNRPVIAPHMGAVAELQKTLGQQWIYSYNGDLSGENMAQALSALEYNNRPEVCPLDNYSWDKLAAYTLTFYRELQAAAPDVAELPESKNTP